jgi:hypothetical protein
MGKLEGKVVRVVRYDVSSGTAKEKFVFPQKFSGDLQIMPKRNVIDVVDYASGKIVEIGRDGTLKWETKIQPPTLARMDPNGNIWLTLNSGYVFWKTPDSSEPEPILRPNGDELTVEYTVDIAPTANGSFWFIDEGNDPKAGGELFLYSPTGDAKQVTTVPGDRILLSKLGGIVAFKLGVIRHVSAAGATKTLWTAPSDIATQIRYFDRAPDGRLCVAAPSANGGIALILDTSVEK